MDELRDWLKVPADAYKSWKDLKRNVVDIAVDEINKRAEDAGFSIDYECVREGKARVAGGIRRGGRNGTWLDDRLGESGFRRRW